MTKPLIKLPSVEMREMGEKLKYDPNYCDKSENRLKDRGPV